MKRTQLKRKTALKAKPTKRKRRKPLEKYKAPRWFNRIPYGSHGSTPAQKRLWKVLSDTYRQEDFELYQGRCPICNKPVEDWNHLQLGHFHRWSLCNSFFKFARENLLGICASCNIHDGGLTSYKFAERLKQKYGEDHLLWIEQENQRWVGKKMETWALVDYVAKVRPDLVDCEE